MKSLKSVSSIVSISLLLVLTVLAISNFNGWYSSYNSKILSSVSEQSNLDFELKYLISDILYFNLDSDIKIKKIKILDPENIELCNLNIINDIDSLNVISYFDFENYSSLTVYDKINSSVIGTLENGAKILNEDSIDGNYLELNDIRDNTRLSINREFPEFSKNFIFSIWFKSYNLTDRKILLGINNQVSIKTRIHSNIAFYYRNTSGSNLGIDSSIPNYLLLDNWYNLAVIFDNSSKKIKVFINGEFEEEFNYSGITSSPNSVYFGFDPGFVNADFQGLIDDVIFINKSISENEVKSLYNSKVSDLRSIDLSSCNLKKRTKYSILAFSDSNFVESSFYNS